MIEIRSNLGVCHGVRITDSGLDGRGRLAGQRRAVENAERTAMKQKRKQVTAQAETRTPVPAPEKVLGESLKNGSAQDRLDSVYF